MATVLRMPGVSADATEAALLEWTVRPGASVRRGDVVAIVETDKAVVELEAEEDAVLLKTFASAGQLVPIGDPLAVFVQPGEQEKGEAAILAELGLSRQSSGLTPAGDQERSPDVLVPGATPALELKADLPVSAKTASHGRIFASPLARRIAAAGGLGLQGLQGSGPGSRIRRGDVEQALRRQGGGGGQVEEGGAGGAGSPSTARSPAGLDAPMPEPARLAGPPPVAPSSSFVDVPHTRFRRAVASALTASKQQVPHFYLKATCRVDELLELRSRANAEGGLKITINDLFVKAAGRAMAEIPDMNVIWTTDAVRRFESVDIAVAMSTDRGLMTPVVRAVDKRPLSDLSATIKDLATRAGGGSLKQQELEGGSLTVSNLGMYGIEEFAAIINSPQAGILAVGAVTSRPVEVDGPAGGTVGFGKFVKVVLSVDHRPVDGALAAQWLQQLKGLIENPLRLLL